MILIRNTTASCTRKTWKSFVTCKIFKNKKEQILQNTVDLSLFTGGRGLGSMLMDFVGYPYQWIYIYKIWLQDLSEITHHLELPGHPLVFLIQSETYRVARLETSAGQVTAHTLCLCAASSCARLLCTVWTTVSCNDNDKQLGQYMTVLKLKNRWHF